MMGLLNYYIRYFFLLLFSSSSPSFSPFHHKISILSICSFCSFPPIMFVVNSDVVLHVDHRLQQFVYVCQAKIKRVREQASGRQKKLLTLITPITYYIHNYTFSFAFVFFFPFFLFLMAYFSFKYSPPISISVGLSFTRDTVILLQN